MTPMQAAAGVTVVAAFLAGAWAGRAALHADIAAERAAAVGLAMKEEVALRGRMEESHARTIEELARLRIERAELDRAGRDLRVRLGTAVAAARAASAAGGETAGDPIGVLADVLERADAHAGVLAAYADSARASGLACERSYDALKRR